MLKRLRIYYKERYPIFSRMLLGLIIFLELHFIVLLNQGLHWKDFHIGIQEAVGAFTVFAFLLWLRVADDLKDFETDKKLFPDRPLPSGRVLKKDIIISNLVVQSITVILNLVYLRDNILFFLILYAYGYLMSKWFFQKAKIQPSLPLALVTHNPVQAIVNLYIIAFTVKKYHLSVLTLTNITALWTLYFPALIWEISRKIRAPKDENEYTTYSKLFGYQRSTRFVLILTLMDIVTNFILVWNLNKVSVVLLALLVSWMTMQFLRFMKDPEQFTLVDRVERYTYLQESTMLLTIAAFLIFGKI